MLSLIYLESMHPGKLCEIKDLGFSPQVIGEVLRRYLCSLSEPLLTFALYDSFLMAEGSTVLSLCIN